MGRASFLIVTALLEVSAGLVLLTVPALALQFLLGVGEAASETLLVARIAGAALLAIGVTCWLARQGEPNPAQFGVLAGALIYDVAAAGLLAYAGLGLNMTGIALWPAVGLHTALAVWSVACIRS
jgi:hypothetical protein